MNRSFKIKFDNKIIKKYHYGEEKLIKLRREVNKLYFNHHLSKNMIAKRKGLSKKFVIKWTKSPNQDFTKDNRGWQKGKRRKWTKEMEKKIKEIHQQLEIDPHQFYTGATAINQEWRKKYPDLTPPLLAEWNLKQEQLYIYFEKEQKSKMIKKLSFKINPRSKKLFK